MLTNSRQFFTDSTPQALPINSFRAGDVEVDEFAVVLSTLLVPLVVCSTDVGIGLVDLTLGFTFQILAPHTKIAFPITAGALLCHNTSRFPAEPGVTYGAIVSL